MADHLTPSNSLLSPIPGTPLAQWMNAIRASKTWTRTYQTLESKDLCYIHRIPREILTEIFLFHLDGVAALADRPTIKAGNTDPIHLIPGLLPLSQTCSDWRSITFAESVFWSRFTIILSDFSKFKHADAITLLTKWIERSRGHSLSFNLRYFYGDGEIQIDGYYGDCRPKYKDMGQAILQLLIQASPRWKDVAISLPFSLLRPLIGIQNAIPMLHSLSIESISRSIDYSWRIDVRDGHPTRPPLWITVGHNERITLAGLLNNAPALRCLSFSTRNEDLLGLEDLQAPHNQLHAISCRSPTPHRILTTMPNLHRCHIEQPKIPNRSRSDSDQVNGTMAALTATLSCNFLTRMEVKLTDDHLFTSLTLPALSELDIKAKGRNCLELVVDLLERSQCHLDVFSIETDILPKGFNVTQFLLLMSTVTRFILSVETYPATTLLQFLDVLTFTNSESAQDARYLTEVRKLGIIFRNTPGLNMHHINHLLIDMFESRWKENITSNGKRSQLRSVVFSPEVTQYKDLIARLVDMDKDGLNFHMHFF